MGAELMDPVNEYRSKVLALDQNQLLSWIFRCTRNFQPADDLLQEVYERLLSVDSQRAAKIQSVQRYAFGIVRHVAHDWSERKRRSPIDYSGSPEDFTAADQDRVEDIVAAQQEIALLCAEIRMLPARCREILILVKMLGYNAREVSAHLGIAESTVKKQLQIAAVRCHAALNDKTLRPGLLLLAKVLVRRKARV